MRDFDIVKNFKGVDESKKQIMESIISEAYQGMGRIQLGVNLVNFETIPGQYKDFLFKTCSVDCYVFSKNILSEEKYSLEEIFDLMKKASGNIMFVNMYDGDSEEEVEYTYSLIDMFIKNNIGSLLYNMNIRKKKQTNANYLSKLRDKFIKAKENTERKVKSIEKFLLEYDNLIQSKDKYTAEHSRAVCKFSLEIGKKLHLKPTDLQVLTMGAALHDIGKYEIDIEILTKNKGLSNTEFRQMKNHPLIGKAILDALFFEELNERDNDIVEFIVEQHHEKYDGTGYPRKIDFSFMHEFSMIVAVADSFHAMLGRSYQNPKTRAQIIQNIKECSGTQFNPKYVEIFCDMLENDLETLGLVRDENDYLRYCLNDNISKLFLQAKNAYTSIKMAHSRFNEYLDFGDLLISY